MKLGILNAVTPQEEQQFNVYEKEAFGAFIGKATNGFTIREYQITQGEFPATTDECDAYLLTGSSSGVYDSDTWISQLAAFIRAAYDQGRKMVGICFGHQMLAHTLGGNAQKSEKGWGMGLRQFEILERRPWMNPPLNNGQLYFCHQDQVAALPASAVLLAGSKFCPNGMFVIGDQVLGIQGHPEFSSEFMSQLIVELRGEAGERVADKAAISMKNGLPDDKILAQWVVNFLEA